MNKYISCFMNYRHLRTEIYISLRCKETNVWEYYPKMGELREHGLNRRKCWEHTGWRASGPFHNLTKFAIFHENNFTPCFPGLSNFMKFLYLNCAFTWFYSRKEVKRQYCSITLFYNWETTPGQCKDFCSPLVHRQVTFLSNYTSLW